MARLPKARYTREFKIHAVSMAKEEGLGVAELASEFGVHQTMVHKWLRQLKESAPGIFSGEIKTEEAKREKELTRLHAKIGQLTVERDFLAEAWGKR